MPLGHWNKLICIFKGYATRLDSTPLLVQQSTLKIKRASRKEEQRVAIKNSGQLVLCPPFHFILLCLLRTLCAVFISQLVTIFWILSRCECLFPRIVVFCSDYSRQFLCNQRNNFKLGFWAIYEQKFNLKFIAEKNVLQKDLLD